MLKTKLYRQWKYANANAMIFQSCDHEFTEGIRQKKMPLLVPVDLLSLRRYYTLLNAVTKSAAVPCTFIFDLIQFQLKQHLIITNNYNL